MTFLGRGDLAPRRRPRRWPRRLALLGVVLVVAAAGVFAWKQLRPQHSDATLPLCPKPSASPLPLAASAKGIVLRILNTTPRDGLAHRLQVDLTKRGFKVAGVGNAKPQLPDVALIRYAPGALGNARMVAEHVAGKPRLVEDARAGKAVEVWIGAGFTRLATPAEVTAAHRSAQAETSPVPAPKPTASCRAS